MPQLQDFSMESPSIIVAPANARRAPNSNRGMKLLVISYAGIGDTLFATPLIHELRANFPDATIDAFVRWPGSKNLLENNPHIDTVYQEDLLKKGNLASPAFLSSLRRNKYDVSINTHPQSRIHYRFVARIINARLRISHRY